MHPLIKDHIIKELTAMENRLFLLHRDADNGDEKNRLGVAWISVKEARTALTLESLSDHPAVTPKKLPTTNG